jgi:hypothetical protein
MKMQGITNDSMQGGKQDKASQLAGRIHSSDNANLSGPSAILKQFDSRDRLCKQLSGIDGENRLCVHCFVSSLDNAVEVRLGNCGGEAALILFEIKFKFNIVSVQLQAHFRWME